MKIRFLLPASKELDEAEVIRYCDHQLPGLGTRLYQEVEATSEGIRFMPQAWTKISERTRRCLITGFPCALHYIAEPDEILITAVAHLHRGLEHYRNRLV